MKVTIMQPEKKDQNEMIKLFTSVITENFKEYGFYEKYKQDIEYEVGKQTDALQRYFDSNSKELYFLIAKNGDKIIGTIAYGKVSTDIKTCYKINLENIPEVKSAYVLPDYQGKGIGTMLFEGILKVLKQNGFAEFCMDSGYPKAQRFWRNKLGEPVVRIVNRWGAGNDYLIWHHSLQS